MILKKPMLAMIFCMLLFSDAGASGVSFDPDCGPILKLDPPQSSLYVYCPNLADTSPTEILSVLDKVFRSVGGVSLDGEVLVIFVSDRTLFDSVDWPPIDLNAMHTTWGSALVGWYYTHSGELELWPNDSAKRRTLLLE